MKKILLLAAVAVSAMTANAQAFKPETMVKASMKKSYLAKEQVMAKPGDAKKVGPKKNVVDGCYYVRPEGSLAYGFNKEGMGYYNARVVVPPYTTYEMVNKSTKEAEWSWAALNSPEYIVNFINDNGNFEFNMNATQGYYMPTISNGKTEYTWGKTDNTYGNTYESFMLAMEEVSPLTYTDPHMGDDYIGWGYLTSHYLFGDGQVDDDGTTYQCYAVAQDFEKPMSPLYVEDIFVSLLNLDSRVFLNEGDELTLDIANAEGEVLYTLTAGADDITIENDGETYETAYGDMRFAQAVFTMKDIDPLTGDVAAVPFVLDDAFTVIISGFEGKNIGMRGHFMMDDDRNPTAEAAVVENGYNLFYNTKDENDQTAFTFTNKISVPMTFSAMFDKAEVWTSAYLDDETEISDFNVLNVSADGQTVQNAGFADVNVAYVNTACSWFDADDTEVYYLADNKDEFPEWLAYGIDNSNWKDLEAEDFKPLVYVGFQAEPLPQGVTGRGVKLYVNGRGITSEDAIYVLQGDYTKEMCDDAETTTGINSVLAPKSFNGKSYSINGQQVNINSKGIVINNGKKFINK